MIPSNIIWILQVHEWGKSMCIPQLNIMLNHDLTNQNGIVKNFRIFTITQDNLHFVCHQYCLITFLGFLFGLHVRINGWQPNMLLTPETLFDNNLCLSYMCIERLFASSWYLIGWFKNLNQRSKTYFSEWLFWHLGNNCTFWQLNGK